MSERKVLNKYYPPDFDPSKIPKLREPKNKVFSIRIMAPFNMRCNVCGEYIYKGKKFNSRKEDVSGEDFLGLRIFRFYIRCPKCVAEIAFKTDLKNTDYTLEAGATRLFEAEKLAQQMAEQERLEKEAEELNPMTVLENRTKASHKEMAQIDELEELREINARHAKVDTSVLLEKQRLFEDHLHRLQQEEEDQFVESIFGNKQSQRIKRLADSDSEASDDGEPKAKRSAPTPAGKGASDLLVDGNAPAQQNLGKESKVSTSTESWQRSVGTLSSSKKSLAGLVVKKKTTNKPDSNKPGSNKPDSNKPDSTSSSKPNGTSSLPPSSSSSGGSPVPNSSGGLSAAGSSGGTAVVKAMQSSSAVVPGVTSSAGGSGGSAPASSGLGLLGGYSDSESAEESD